MDTASHSNDEINRAQPNMKVELPLGNACAAATSLWGIKMAMVGTANLQNVRCRY